MDHDQHDLAAVSEWEQSSHHNEVVTLRCYCGRRAGVVCRTPRGPLFVTWVPSIPGSATLHSMKNRTGKRVPEQFMPRAILLEWPGAAEEWPVATLFCRCHPKFREGVDIDRAVLLERYDEAVKTHRRTKLTVPAPAGRGR